MRAHVRCADCGQDRPHHSRTLCGTCYWHALRGGTLDNWPLLRVPNVGIDGRREDYAWLRDQGHSIAVAAARVGVTERTGWRYERTLRQGAAA